MNHVTLTWLNSFALFYFILVGIHTYRRRQYGLQFLAELITTVLLAVQTVMCGLLGETMAVFWFAGCTVGYLSSLPRVYGRAKAQYAAKYDEDSAVFMSHVIKRAKELKDEV